MPSAIAEALMVTYALLVAPERYPYFVHLSFEFEA